MKRCTDNATWQKCVGAQDSLSCERSFYKKLQQLVRSEVSRLRHPDFHYQYARIQFRKTTTFRLSIDKRYTVISNANKHFLFKHQWYRPCCTTDHGPTINVDCVSQCNEECLVSTGIPQNVSDFSVKSDSPTPLQLTTSQTPSKQQNKINNTLFDPWTLTFSKIKKTSLPTDRRYPHWPKTRQQNTPISTIMDQSNRHLLTRRQKFISLSLVSLLRSSPSSPGCSSAPADYCQTIVALSNDSVLSNSPLELSRWSPSSVELTPHQAFGTWWKEVVMVRLCPRTMFTVVSCCFALVILDHVIYFALGLESLAQRLLGIGPPWFISPQALFF